MLRDGIRSGSYGLIAVGSRARCPDLPSRCEYRRCHSPCRPGACRDWRIIAFDLVRFAAGHVEGQRVAFGVRAEVDFGREAAARATERFPILIPPFTPAACWCARTMVESMACSLSAGGPRLAKVSNTASHTPSLLQRVKRTKTEFQLPYRFGMSRQGAPVRRTQRMPLTVRRLSFIGGPRSPRSGRSGSKICHSASV